MAEQSPYRSLPLEQTLFSYYFKGSEIRTAISNDWNVWFCAKDCCRTLDISWSGQTLQKYPAEWRCKLLFHNKSARDQYTNFINEPAVFRLSTRSRKDRGREFSTWLFEEVLPATRRWDVFAGISVSDECALTESAITLLRRITETVDEFERRALIERSRRLFRLLGQRMPDLTLIGQNVDQNLPGV